MKKQKNILSLLLAGILMMGIVGCAQTDTAVDTGDTTEGVQESEVASDVLVINGLGDEKISFTLEEVMAFEPYAQEVSSLSSSGEIKVVDIVGTLLDDLLESVGYTTANCESIRLVASDGYEISIPSDVIANKEIIIAYEQDGEMYDEFGAFRSVIPDERAMYWVYGIVELNFEYSETVGTDITQIIFMENVGEDVVLEDYTYYDSVDQALSIASLMETYVNIGEATSGAFVASDGLETEQTVDVLNTGYMKMTGENAPLFISPDMPKGMQVKGVQYLNVGDTCFTSIAILAESDSVTGLQSILNDCGMTGTTYIATGVDGSETILEGTAISGSAFEVEDGAYYLVNTEESIKIELKTIQQQ